MFSQILQNMCNLLQNMSTSKKKSDLSFAIHGILYFYLPTTVKEHVTQSYITLTLSCRIP